MNVTQHTYLQLAYSGLCKHTYKSHDSSAVPIDLRTQARMYIYTNATNNVLYYSNRTFYQIGIIIYSNKTIIS